MGALDESSALVADQELGVPSKEPQQAPAVQAPSCPRRKAVLLFLGLLSGVAVITLLVPCAGSVRPGPGAVHVLKPQPDAVALLLAGAGSSRLPSALSMFFQLAAPGVTGAEVVQHLHGYNPNFNGDNHDDYTSYIVFATGNKAPIRGAEGQPFLTVEAGMVLPGVAALNRAAAALESVLHRRLFPITMRADELIAPASTGPYAVFDFSTGELVVDRSIADAWRLDHVQYLVGALGDALFTSLQTQVGALNAATGGGVEALLPVLAASVAAALVTAFAAAPPLWFCLACPTVLGLLAPLAINFGLGDLAGIACSRLQLPDDQCFDLMLGALGLGFVLSMASAVPIFMVCRMSECAHRPPAAFPASLLGRLRA